MAITTVPLAYLNYKAAKEDLDLRFSLLGPMIVDFFVAIPMFVILLMEMIK